jgi:hypothetical protein
MHKILESQSLEFIWTIHQKGHVSIDWSVREFRAWDIWSVLVWKLLKPEVTKTEELKWWGMMMSPGDDVDPRRLSSSEIQSSRD